MDSIRSLLATVVLMVAPAVAVSQTSEVYVFLDRAGTGPGCSISIGTPPSTTSDVDGQVRVTIDQGSNTVTQVAVSTCSSGLLSTEDISSPAGHPVGIGNGVGSSNVVEFGVDQSLLFPGPGIDGGSITIAALSGDSVDLAAGGALISTQLPTAVPTLQSWAVLLLALLLGTAAVFVLRKNRGLMLVALVVVSASAWAMVIVLDGMTGDWAGVTQAGDPQGDPTIGGPYSDVRAVFATRNNGTVFFRVDVADQALPSLLAVDDVATTDEDSSVAIPSVFANDNNPNAGTLTLQSVDTTGLAGALTNNNDGTFSYDPNGAFEALPAGAQGSDSFDYTVSDGTDTSTATVTITINGVNDAPTIDSTPVTVGTADTLYTYSVAASDPDNPDPLTLAATVLPSWLTFTDNGGGSGTLEGTPTDSDAGNNSVTITVTDSATTSDTQSFTIVVAANDPVAADDAFTIDEDSGLNTFDVTANDANPGSATLSIGAVTQGTQGMVAISGTDVTYTPNPDACNDGAPADSFTYTLNPGATVATVSVTITCLNDAPVVNDQMFGVAETATNGTAIGMVAASDVDTSDTLSYAFNPPSPVFAIDASGTVTVADETQLDFETTPTYNLAVEVTDDGTPVMNDTATVTINVTDDNDPPTINPQTFMLAENSPNATSVGTVVANDPDSGQSLTYTIMPASAVFTINSMTGEITVTDSAALDFETTPSFNLTVVVTDDGGVPLMSMATITINLTDENEPPVVNDQMFSIDEDAADMASVGTVIATDVDAGDSLMYAITMGNVDGNLQINATTGEITVANPPGLDFEMTAGYALTVQVTDSLGPASDTATISVTVNDVNDAPTITTGATASVAENTTAVANIDATDPEGDTEGSGLTYSISGGADAALFGINVTTGALFFLSAPDFENPTDANTDNDYLVDVTVTDSGALSDTLMMTVSVTDVNEPPVVNDQMFSIDEDAADMASVGTVMANDVDAGDSLMYAITMGNVDGNLQINATTGEITVVNPPGLDFEMTAGYSLTVQVTDSLGPASDTATITVTVNDVNEAPTITTAATASVAESTTAVADIDATDPEGDTEGGGGLTYSISGGADAALFSIDTNSGALTFMSAPDFEMPTDANTDNDYEVDVTVTDSGALTDTLMITVTVTDANDPPTITSMASVSVDENTTAVIDIMATDPEGDTEGAGLTYAITGGADMALFSVAVNTGVLTFMSAPDFEAPGDVGSDNVYNVQITVTDSGTLTDVQDLAITVVDVNEAPSASDDSYSVQSNVGVTPPALVGLLTNDTDPDSGDTLTVDTVTGAATTAGGSITIAADGSFTYIPQAGDASVADTFVYTLRDSANNTDTGTITFNVDANTIWFVDLDAAAGGDGTLSTPFDSLADVDNGGPDGDNHTIFLYSSTGNTSASDNLGGEDFDLQPGQHLIGEGVTTAALDINAFRGFTTYANSLNLPALAGPNHVHTGAGITLSTNNTIRGIDIGSTNAAHAITGNGFTTLTIDDVSISGTGGLLNLTNGAVSDPTAGDATFSSLTTSSFSGSAAIFNTVTGTITVGSTTITGAVSGIDIASSPALVINHTGTLAITATGGFGLRDSGGATLNFSGTTHTIAATGGPALQLTTTGLSGGATFASLSSANSPTTGIQLNGVTGSLVANGGSILNAAGTAFDVGNGMPMSGGVDTITYAGSINNAAGRAVSIRNRAGGAVTLSGTITDNGGSNSGVLVDANLSNSQISFSNTVSVTNSSGAAVSVSNNATGSTTFANIQIDNSVSNQTGLLASFNNGTHTLNVATGAIDAGTQRALDLDNTVLGVNLVRVDSVGGGVPGIDIDTTTGSLTIAGTGGDCQNNALQCSGGVISNKTANIDAVLLDDATNIVLSHMQIDNNSRNGVFANTVNGLMLNQLRLVGNADQAAPDEAAIHLLNVTGTALAGSNPTMISNVRVSNSHEHNVIVRNNAAGMLAELAVADSIFENNGASTQAANNFFIDTSSNANVTVNATDSQFVGSTTPGMLTAFGFVGDAADTATLSVSVSGSTFTNNNVGLSASVSGNANVNFDFLNNPSITGHPSNAINLFTNSGHTGSFTGTVSGNTIGTPGVMGSGSEFGSGIRFSNEGGGTATVLINGNTVREMANFEGIVINNPVSAGTSNVTVTGNTITDTDFDRGLVINQTSTGGVTCANISGNSFMNIADATPLRVRHTNGTLNVTQASMAALSTANGGVAVSEAGTVAYNQAACPTP